MKFVILSLIVSGSAYKQQQLSGYTVSGCIYSGTFFCASNEPGGSGPGYPLALMGSPCACTHIWRMPRSASRGKNFSYSLFHGKRKSRHAGITGHGYTQGSPDSKTTLKRPKAFDQLGVFLWYVRAPPGVSVSYKNRKRKENKKMTNRRTLQR